MIDNKLLLFGGKGGVGKTSMAAATALQAASKGKKVLVMSTDPAHSLSDSFSVEIGNKITKIKDNLFGLEIDAAALLEEYKQKYGDLIKQIADEGTFFSKDDIQQFFDLSLPGMDELMALLRVIDILNSEEYDLLVLDTAPTGHTIRLLELPVLMTAYVKVLAEMRRKHHVVVSMMTRGRYVQDKADEFINKMHKDIEQLRAVLKDTSTKFVPVLIPEAMAIAETERLMIFLDKQGVHVHEMIVNQVLTNACDFCKARVLGQQKYLSEIKKKYKDFSVKEIPLFPTEVKGKNLENLSSLLFGGKYVLPESGLGKDVDLSLKKLKLEKLTINPSTEFLLFGGKGGVGKTSCAAATALEASKDKRVLVFSTDPAHSLSDSFGVPIGNQVTKIPTGSPGSKGGGKSQGSLSALEVDSYTLLDKLKKQYRKEINEFFSSVFKSTTRATIDAPYDRRVMEGLFDLCPPGIDEIMALKTMMDLMEEDRYDLFILDTAPTGHAIRLLEIPKVAEDWVRALLEIQEKYPISFEIGDTLQEMLETIKKVREVLLDPAKAEFVVVSIPEAMSVLETNDLVGSLKNLQVSARYVVINKIIPLAKCDFCSQKRKEQLVYVKQLQVLKLKIVPVELFPSEIQGAESLRKLAGLLF